MNKREKPFVFCLINMIIQTIILIQVKTLMCCYFGTIKKNLKILSVSDRNSHIPLMSLYSDITNLKR